MLKNQKKAIDLILQKDLKTLDFSFHDISSLTELLNFFDGNSTATSIRLSNNRLSNLKGLEETFQKVVSPSDQVLWVDLSFNNLSSLDEVIQSFPNLRVLYLHGNRIESLSQLDKLSNLKELRNLTLHGNPVVQVPNYKFYILSRLPRLKHLDFSAITKQDRMTTRVLVNRQSVKQRKSKL